MPLCPQITNTPITVSLTADFTVTNVIPVLPATTTQVAAVQQTADEAYAEAVAAGTAASTAQTTADGKNKVTYSTSAPGSTANAAGDIWYQYGTAAPNVGRIIAQYSGAGGTSWTQTTISGLVVANIDAGSITTGTLSVGLGITTGSGTFTVNAATGALFANSATITGTITSTSGSIGGFVVGPTYLSTGAGGTGFFINSSSGAGSFNALTANGTLLANSGLTLATGACTVSAGGNTFNNVGNMNLPTGNLTLVSGRVTTNLLTVDSTATMNGDVNLATGKDLRVPFAFDTTTANAATVWISSTGQFRRSTASSERYKTDIVNLIDVPELDPKALYDLPVRAFRFKEGYLPETDDRFGVLVPGFIAEEMDAIYPAATDYTDGVETWNDRMIIPAMLALIQDQETRIKALEGE
jgi:hypothetical protein